MKRRCAERGSATIWVLIAATVLVGFAVTGVLVGAAAAASRRANSSADFAALAGADTLVHDTGEPCARASFIAAANGALLTRCEVDGPDLRVWVEVELPRLAGFGVFRAHGRARAGPQQRPVL